ncbi:hypothetical protein ACFO5R_06950 [Halosolutus amylolyticus]|uniref:Uncharacterized protein n=1 Tax=Halosolutus amylolyticus TaxID=2932267 RepID=A0ABD5PME6_9EURY|nr:hypothetical protein [Halosolutus amylolyticus]
MPSTDFPRRRLLAAGGCLSAVLAGCAGLGESETTAEHTAADGGTAMPSDEYDALTLRSDDDEYFVVTGEDSPNERDDDRSRSSRYDVAFVVTDDEAADVRIDSDDADAARSFLEATDFETESVVIEQRPIDDCYRRHLLSVQARPDEFRTQYCRSLKSPTTPCEADLTVMEAIFVRVQQAYDDSPSSRASGESASCPDSVFETDDTSGGTDDSDGETGHDANRTDEEADG